MSKKSKPLPRGFVNNIILQSLVDGDKYGYEIIKEVEEITNGEIVLKQPSLYSSLKRFETRGFISSYWGDSTIGGRRHYYTLTETGREYFEQQIKSGEIAVEDIVYENVEEEVKAEISEQAESLLEENETFTKNTNKETIEQTKLSEQAKEEVKKNKIIVNDVNSEDYNVFDLLEADNSKTESKTVKTEEIEDDAIVFETDEIEVLDNDKVLDNNSETLNNNDEVESDENYSEEIYEYLSENKNIVAEIDEDGLENKTEDEETESESEKPTTTLLPEQTSLNFNNLESKPNSDNFNEFEDKTEFIEPAKIKANSVVNEIDEINETLEEHKEIEKRKVEILVDEYGIKKSSLDTAPRRKTKRVDNVGERIQYIDPLYKTLENKQQQKPQKQEQAKTNSDAVSSYDKKNFEETDKKISEKFQKAVVQKFGKIESLDYKNLLGEVYFDEKAIEKQKLESDTIKLPDSYDDEYFESYDSTEETSTIKNTPYTSLEESLEKEGFKFKPYNIKFAPSKKRPEFLLSNKIGFYLGLVMFVLMLAQYAGFGVYLAHTNFSFSTADKVLVGISLAVLALVLIVTATPYIAGRKKRKYNSFRLSTTLVYMLVAFTSFILLTYAVNTFFGLTFKNISKYTVTLFLPIIVFSNLLIWPIVYRLLITSKKFY